LNIIRSANERGEGKGKEMVGRNLKEKREEEGERNILK
jgi:hypothetical protein